MTDGRWYSTATNRRVMTTFGLIGVILGLLFFIGLLDASDRGEAPVAEAWIWGITWVGGGVFYLTRGRAAGVRPEQQGLYIRNLFKSYFYRWDEIGSFRLRPSGGFVSVGLVLLRNGLERPVAGVRVWARRDQEPLIDELNQELTIRRAPSRPDR